MGHGLESAGQIQVPMSHSLSDQVPQHSYRTVA